jgi:hypothetical protein
MNSLNDQDRKVILSVIRGLMCADNLGDVHLRIETLRSLVGLKPLEGSFVTGWELEDWEGTEDN